uniref:Endonuclease-reverse transcriptase n=1 Tax=Cacopsylla melanoneura TaxID=428564 RepID=A0A8D8UPB2_9HEMI
MSELIEKVVSELAASRNMMMEEFRNTNAKIDTMEKKLDPLMKRMDIVEKKMETYTKQMDTYYEKEKRKRNVIIFGIEQEQGENYVTLEEKVRNMIREKMDITILSTEVDSVKRFGRAQNNQRPIIMALTTWKRKMELISNGRKLKGTGISIREDFPQEVQRIRKSLYEEMMEHRRNGRKAYIRYDKLIVEGNENNGNKKEEDEKEEIEMMEDETKGGSGSEKGKRKAETDLKLELKKDNRKQILKKTITRQRSYSGSRVVLSQSKLDCFVNNSLQSTSQQNNSQPNSPLVSQQNSSQTNERNPEPEAK